MSTSWRDVDAVMAFWYRNSAVGAWDDWMELTHELETLDSVGHLWTTADERAIHQEMWEDLQDQLSCTTDELRPQLRLAAANK